MCVCVSIIVGCKMLTKGSSAEISQSLPRWPALSTLQLRGESLW